LCILGAGHFLIYFAVKNVKYDEGNAGNTSVVAQGTTQNQTEPEG
ncbi:MFS transporter, partial [Bacillus paranthracis]|nr:MFS transporter [Bacillus paranthracis]